MWVEAKGLVGTTTPRNRHEHEHEHETAAASVDRITHSLTDPTTTNNNFKKESTHLAPHPRVRRVHRPAHRREHRRPVLTVAELRQDRLHIVGL